MTLRNSFTKLEFFFDKLLISPRKLKNFTKIIVNKDLITAYLYLLKNFHYKAAKLLIKNLKFIINFIIKKHKSYTYFFKEIIVTKSLTLKRLQPRAKGRSFKIERKYSFIKFKLIPSLNSRLMMHLLLNKFEEILFIYPKNI